MDSDNIFHTHHSNNLRRRRSSNTISETLNIPENTISRKREEGGDAFTVPYWKLDILLTILGAVPRATIRPYLPCLKPCNATLLYSIVILLAVAYSLYDTGMGYVRVLKMGLSFHQLLGCFVGLVNLLPFGSTLTVLVDVPALRQSQITWMSLTKEYYRITGTSILKQVKYREYAYLFLTLGIPFTSISCGTMLLPDAKMQWKALPQSAHGSVVLLAVMLGWAGKCSCLGVMAATAGSHLQEKLKKGENPEVVFADFQRLWYKIRDVIKHTELLSLSVMFTLTLFRTVILVYRVITAFYSFHISYGCFFIYCCWVLGFEIYTLSYISRISSYQLQSTLCNVSMDTYKCTKDSKIHTEIMQFFLSENTKPPALVFNQFYRIDKKFFTFMLAILSEYTLLLVQFNLPYL